jgi:hypothetical protein
MNASKHFIGAKTALLHRVSALINQRYAVQTNEEKSTLALLELRKATEFMACSAKYHQCPSVFEQ